ncbi:D-inositol 3-phosphate glycosyltransferase [bacterium HR36]|nr:D-inositol 3-phosphate glycosyltransferase [bacterium HR36]
MRVLVNVWSGLGPPAGVGHYARQLVAALQQTAAAGDAAIVFPQGGLARWYQGRTQAPDPRRGFAGRQTGALQVSFQWLSCGASWMNGASIAAREALRWYLGRRLRSQLRTVRADLYHEPNFVPLCFDVPTAITVHDLSPILFPQWHPSYRVRWLEKYLERSLIHAQHILTVSEFTRQELIKHCGIAPERIQVTYPGVRSRLRPCSRSQVRFALAKLGLPTDYLLFVGTLEPRKNLELVLRAYLRLPRSYRQAVPFVLVGKYGWQAERLAELIATTGPSEGIYSLGYVPEDWLVALYNGARALVYPSLYEGFGLPPMEMLACGGQVIVADLPVFRETLASYAIRVPADDADAWYGLLRRLVVHGECTAAPNWAAVVWAGRFTWENCARQTWQAFTSPPVATHLAA